MLTRQGLVKVKVRALRSKVWFKALSRVERAIFDLTIHCVEKVRSQALMKTLLTILDKLLKTLEEDYMKKIESIGREIAQKISVLASRWGNSHAWTWKYDLNFVRYLGANALNT